MSKSYNNTKTYADELFENYLNQCQLKYKFEPFLSDKKGKKIPDYMFEKAGKKILVECKEIDSFPMDGMVGTLSFSMDSLLNPLKDKIKIASRQLKPYKDMVDYSVIIFAKKNGFPIELDNIKYAMFGEPVFRIPIDAKRAGVNMYVDFKANGKLRRNDPQSGLTIPFSRYIGAIGIVNKINAQYFYLMKYINKERKKRKSDVSYDNENIGDITKKWLDILDIQEKCFKKLTPDQQDPNREIFFVEIVINPFADNPLPKDIFSNIADIVQEPHTNLKVIK